MATSELDKVISNLRACLISAPGGMMMSDLNKDYRSLVGEYIPYKRLGCSSLDDFVQCIPNVKVAQRGGDWHISAMATADSSHISSLVQGQKKTSKKPRKANFTSFKTNRSSVPKFHPVSNQTPHFMQEHSAGRASHRKPKAQYIADKQPAITLPPSKPKMSPPAQSFHPNQSKLSYYVAPEDMPVTTYPVSGSKSSFAKPQSPEPRKVTDRELLTSPVPASARNPPPYTSLAPSEPTKPAQKVPKPSVTDRLNIYRKNPNLSSISESSIYNKESNRNDTSNSVIPENFPCEVKVFDPISWNKDKNRKQRSDTHVVQSLAKSKVDVQPYHYDDQSYILKLSCYADKQNWQKPDFYVLNRRVGSHKHPENKYICRVCINCTPTNSQQSSASQAVPHQPYYEFCTYPEEFSDVNSAMSYVAKKAYEALIEKDAIQLPETRDSETILWRISEMVKGKHQGVWLYQIEKMYKAQFNERLPEDLPSLMDNCPTLEISKLAESYYIVRPKHQQVDSTKYFSPTYVSHLTVNKLTYPTDETWDIFVSKVKSLNEIYIRIIGDKYSVVYETLAMEMDAYYVNQDAERPQCIEVGKYYAFVTHDSSFRVLVTSIYNNDYQVYLIDVGDVDFVRPETLRVLLPKFYVVASQAVPCFLVGLHNYDFAMTNPKVNQAVDDMILARSFVSLLSNRDPIHLTLFDTESEEDININAELKRLVDESFSYPDLFEDGILKEIQVMTVDRNGQVFIQLPSWTLDCLSEKIALISDSFYEVSYLSSPSDISQDKIYFWSNGPTRVKVVDVLPNGQLEVDFIDTGGQKNVLLSEIYEIEQLNDLLPRIPPQAVPVLLHDVNDGTLKTHQVQKFLDMVNSNSESPTIGKVVSTSGRIPQIEIFVRNEASNLLVSVNSNLSLYESMSSRASQMSTDQCSNYSIPASTFSHADGIFLKGIIPKIGDDLDIYVTGIANPSNFTVTPVSYLKYLNQLAEEMIIFYSSTSTKEIYRPRIGESVAAQSDGCWFRVQIDKKLDSELYSGKYLDHGHMDVFPIKSLRGLPEKFKKLPYLAFRAQLHGIKPVNKDWNVEDCLAVKSMIHNKKFYSQVRDIINDADGRKLSLEIVDTSTENDIYISRQLVMENRALPVL